MCCWLLNNECPNLYFFSAMGQKKKIFIFLSLFYFQPLTELPYKKCKRCGLYEKDKLSDDTFDEWELCPDEFKGPEGRDIHFKDKEFNATFLCPECIPLESGDSSGSSTPSRREKDKSNHQLFVEIFVSIVVLDLSVVGAVALYRYWRRKKGEEEQARFHKLFEEDDDLEDLSLGNVI
ncbi:hypothetical protein AMTRI_Chr08g207430 [Amborella trichopoda]